MSTDELVEKMCAAFYAKEVEHATFYNSPIPTWEVLHEDYKAEYRDSMRAALAVVPMTEWQPIETAPKDGTRVLLWRRAIRDQPTPIMADGFWCETCWVWPYILSEPTHWQPLPAPPERAGK